ncbi:MAG TPA: sigma factor, partial [Polyangia bacterium]
MDRLELQDVLDRCVVGDERAWREMYRGYYSMVACFLRRMGLSSSELDDACQEVFVQVFRYVGRFERRAEFETWLYKLCLSQATRWRRRDRLRQALAWLAGQRATVDPPTGQPGWTEAAAAKKVGEVLGRMKSTHR